MDYVLKSFIVYEEDKPKLAKWYKHKCPYANGKDGAIGGRFTYCITPTGVGSVYTIKCICGKELDLSHTEDW
jgi:hypothetical protein